MSPHRLFQNLTIPLRPELNNSAPVSLGWTPGWRRRESIHEFPLFSYLLPHCAALFSFAIKRLRHACRPANLAQLQDLNLKVAAFSFDPQHIAYFYFARRLHKLIVRLNPAEFASLRRQRARLEEPCCPKPFVY